MQFQTPYNKETRVFKGEVNSLPSMTVPDQTMSIPELMRRYASGLPLGGERVPMYEEDPENDLLGGQNWNSLDLSEKADIITFYGNEVKETKEKHEKKRKEKEQKELDEKFEQEVQRRIKDKEKP